MTTGEYDLRPSIRRIRIAYTRPPDGSSQAVWSCGSLRGSSTASSSTSSASFSPSPTQSNIWVTGLFTGVLTFIYFVALEVSQGWTLGKKLLGLSVHGPGGAPKPSPTVRDPQLVDATADHPLARWSGAFIAYIVIAVTINSSPTKQGKHDELAGGTQVVKG